ncbi:hypothetical protein [Moraxella marmotae]|uniref:hypothetical protein n=1 Tax=Moraxella marmotae TaxID=3344520 RepID=UPI0035D47B4A
MARYCLKDGSQQASDLSSPKACFWGLFLVWILWIFGAEFGTDLDKSANLLG